MNFTIDSEAKFSKWLMKWLDASGHAQRLESTTSNGIPDINFCLNGGYELWIETKIGCPDKHDVILRKEQYAWGMRRAQVGGHVLILAYCQCHEKISTFKFPNIAVKPYGKEGKYVKIVSDPVAITSRKEFSIT